MWVFSSKDENSKDRMESSGNKEEFGDSLFHHLLAV